MPRTTELPEYECDRLQSAWPHHGRLALVFDKVTILLSVECARAVDDALSEIGEIDGTR